MRVLRLAALIAFASCGNPTSDHPGQQGSSGSGVSASGDLIKGTLSIDGAPVKEMTCRPGAAVHIFVDVVTPAGTLRVEDGKLAFDDEPLTCEKFERSWGGGRRPDNRAYWRGTLSFACVRGAQHIDGNLDLDCGGITAEERAQLDAQRSKARTGS
ncbi:hypothetical protein BH11MYX2_BH11MYX2_35630 [soil metagenome]